MAKGKYYTPELKQQAVKMVVGLDRSGTVWRGRQGTAPAKAIRHLMTFAASRSDPARLHTYPRSLTL
jgi:hypothetical protein